jgi:hypothetical protein
MITKRFSVIASAALLSSICLAYSVVASADVVWAEGTMGDLSTDPAAPTPVPFSVGVNTVVGGVQSSDDTVDYLTFTIAPGNILSGITLVQYVDVDTGGPGNTGFNAINEGSTSFDPLVDPVTSFLGVAHVVNTDVGSDLLAILGSDPLGQGVSFTPPLGPGDYSYLIQQTGTELTGYGLDFIVEDVSVTDIGGTASGMLGQLALCQNLTDLQVVPIPGLMGAQSWDCSGAGLTAVEGDEIVQIIRGRATCAGAPCDVGGEVTGVDANLVQCLNLTTGQQAALPLAANSWSCTTAGFLAANGHTVQQLVRGVAAAAAPLPDCTIDFEGACPDAGTLCGADFAGGTSCVVAGLPFCYSSGIFGYEVPPGDVLTITLNGDLDDLSVFFASGGPGSGTMTFLDAGGVQVGSQLVTNGDCTLAMPAIQQVNFATPVRSIVVENAGPSNIYLDDFRTNP